MTGLHDFADRYLGRIAIETVEITVPAQIVALHRRPAQDLRPNVLWP
jgi:hypothetical protein